MLDITNLTKQSIPKIPWKNLKEKILGKKYELSIALSGSTRMKSLNKKYRKKDKPANTLAFVLDKNEGEIFLNIEKSKNNLIHLYIHSLLHLKGLKHGEKMDKKEQKLLKEFLH